MPEPDTPLRDRLAIRRTELANERTLLAYGRTSLMLLASGATLWRLQPFSTGDRVLGAVVAAAGVAAAAAGLVRFLRSRAEIAADGADTPE